MAGEGAEGSGGRGVPAGHVRGWAGEVSATLALAWPLILSNLAGTALTTVDVLLLGRLGADALAAGALGTNLFHTVFIALIGLVSAVSPLVAAEYGARRHAVREIRRTVRQGLWLAAAVSLPVMALFAQGERLLLLFGQEPGLAEQAGRYLRVLLWALLPNLLFTVLRLFTASLGRPGWGLAIALAGVPVNGGLAWLLIFGGGNVPALGLVGAGLATALTAALGFAALALVCVADRRFRRYHIFGRIWRPDWPRFRAIWRVGLPIGGTLAMETSLFGASGLMMGTIGQAELAAHTIALQISALCFMVPLGLGQAATIRVGHAFGAGDPVAIGRAGWSAFGVALAFTGATALLLFSWPGALVGAFIDPAREPTVLRLGILFLGIAALFQLADGSQAVGAGMLRGLQDTRVPMLLAALGYWGIGAPLGYVLARPFGWGGQGVWVGLATGLGATATLMLWRWSRRERLGIAPRRRDPARPRAASADGA